jgi:RimJ/RimL family protein N-acetyltransferase
VYKMELTVFPLSVTESAELSSLLSNARPEYIRHFTPFSFAVETIGNILKFARMDCYWGMRVGGELAGFFMLRGFDEGYERPSFGVFIAEKFSNKNLGSLALQYSLSWCKLNNISRVMLKVHPENIYARRAYEKAGFELTSVLSDSGQYLFEKRLG